MALVSLLGDISGFAEVVAFAEAAVFVQVLEAGCTEGVDSHCVAGTAG